MQWLAVAGLALVAVASAGARDKFDRLVRIPVGLAAGGTADLMARWIAGTMKVTIGQALIVDKRPS